MAKFCSKCGSPVDEGAKFCKSCGSPIASQPAQPQYDQQAVYDQQPVYAQQPVKKGLSKSAKIILAAVVAAVLIAVVIIIIVAVSGGSDKDDKDDKDGNSSSKSYEDVLEETLKAYVAGDFSGIFDNWLFGAYLKDICDAQGEDYSELRDEIKGESADVADEVEEELGKNCKVTIKITDKEKANADDIKDFESEIKDDWGVDISVTEGYVVYYEAKYEGDDDKITTDGEAELVKIDGVWKVYELDDDVATIDF